MKLTTSTIKTLENFAAINDNILLVQGSKQRTMSVMKNVLAEAEIDIELGLGEELPIYSLSKFLKLLKVVSNPSVELSEDECSIRIFNNSGESIDYRLSDKSVMCIPPNKALTLPTEDVCVTITRQQLDKAVKVAGLLEIKDISITGDGSTIYLKVADKKNSGSDSYKVELGDTPYKFSFNLKVENLGKMKRGDYELTLSRRHLARADALNEELTYFLALEPDSTLDKSWEEETTEEKVVEMTHEEVEEYNSEEETLSPEEDAKKEHGFPTMGDEPAKDWNKQAVAV